MGKAHIAALAGLLLLLAGSANAADAVPSVDVASDELPPVEPLPPDEDPLGAGWYVRASGGYGFAADLDARERRRGFASDRLDGAALALAGAGIKLNGFFRADLTVDHLFESDFRGRYVRAAAGGGTGQVFHDRAQLDATSVLVNGYLDFAIGPIVPYLGAGIGASYLALDNYRSRSGADFGRSRDTGGWNAAWALTAGIGVPLGEKLTLDFGYRFASIGDIRLHAPRLAGRGGAVELDDIVGQHVTAGLRYLF